MAAISRYHIADFGNVAAATTAANALNEYLNSPKGLRHLTGLRRAVMYGEGPNAPGLTMGYLYLSAGAQEAAKELRLSFSDAGEITAEQITPTAKLLFGKPD